MPFGLVFGSLFFFLAAWGGLRLFSGAGPQTKAAGALLVVLGVSLAVGLLSRRDWARRIGAVSAVGLATFAVWRGIADGTVFDLLSAAAGFATALLLLAPATSGRATAARDRRVGVLSVVSAAAAAGLVGVAVWAVLAPVDAAAVGGRSAARAEAPLPARKARVRWVDFGAGLDRARAEDKPLLVNFDAGWCGYCRKMDRETWSHPSVVERLDDLVAVRVDIDDERRKNGFSGTELARTYRVNGTPTQMLIDPSGRILSRAGGFQTPRQLLLWLEDALGEVRGARTVPRAG